MTRKQKLYDDLIASFDEGCDLCARYDTIPHQYGDEVLYQSEMHFLQAVGKTPDATITIIAEQLEKTKSACSQMVRKLMKKDLLTQERNPLNNREYYLHLTEKGTKIFFAHEEFDKNCMDRTYNSLKGFTMDELQTYINIQKQLNKVFAKDVKDHVVLSSVIQPSA